jgi:predicted ATPase/DNA-binding winged helix-turn-helix (wHTH) protein
MEAEETTRARDGILFGPFRLFPAERLLEREGAPLRIGGRALDILIVLIEHAGEVVSHQELSARVWQGVTVEPGSLRFHVAALRKVLGDGQAGARYLTNVAGRGYCFVAAASRSSVAAVAAETVADREAAEPLHKLPPLLTRMVGRDDAVNAIKADLVAHRFVTIVGSGGIGKTTVAVAVAHGLLAAFEGAVCFVELATLRDPASVAGALATTLGLRALSNDPAAAVIGHLRCKRMLLVLDCCEQIINSAAEFAERLFMGCRDVHVLATSREALRAEGEHVYRLPPLGIPPDDGSITVAWVLSFPAAQLFVERVGANHRFELNAADAPTVAEICRKLDGVALAIELAAGRVGAYGIQGIAALLDGRFALLWRGRRTAPPRHQTLHATLDWSFDLLQGVERTILRRLSIFNGTFTLEAAQTVLADSGVDATEIVEAIAGLIAKSLLSVSHSGGEALYWLLDTTRAYAAEKLAEAGEMDQVARRHALYFRNSLETVDSASPEAQVRSELIKHIGSLGNVRAGLEWCFCARGDATLGLRLAVAACPLFVAMSLITECRLWVERSIAVLDDSTRGTRLELELRETYGLCLTNTDGSIADIGGAYERALEIAEALNYPHYQLRSIDRLFGLAARTGDLRGLFSLGRRGEEIASRIADPDGLAMADVMIGFAQHLAGDQQSAHRRIESALARAKTPARLYSSRNGVFITLSKVLWLRGKVDQALAVARQVIAMAEGSEIAIYLSCVVLSMTIPMFHLAGDFAAAEEFLGTFVARTEQDVPRYHPYAMCLRGELLILRNAAHVGVPLLQQNLAALPADRVENMALAFVPTLARGLAMMDRFDEALVTIDDVIGRTEANGDLVNMPNMLIAKGEILGARPPCDPAGAERCYVAAMGMARSQYALSWELRAAISLARLWIGQGRFEEARLVLAPVYGQFSEGFGSLDLQNARALLGGG